VTGRPDQGLGRYKQPDAWRLDRLVELAERLDIRLMCCLETQQNLRRDMGQTAAWGTRKMTALYRKPFLITEYGVGHHGGWVGEDPDGGIVHNGLWGAVMNGSAGTALPWDWGSWVDAQDMYHYWKPVAAVVKDVPFCKREWRRVEVERLAYRDGPGKPYHASVFFEGWPRNYAYTLCPPQPPKVFDVDAEGRVNQQESLRGTLYAGDTLAVEFPVDGSLTVHVPERSAQGDPILEVQVDGAKVLTESLPRDTETAWSYWKFFTVPVLAGAHRIRVSNTGSGTFWAAYELGNYRLREGPDRKGRRSLAGSSARRLLTSFADPMMGPVWIDSGQQKIVKLDGHGTAPVK